MSRKHNKKGRLKSWQLFERLAKKIYSELSPEATVTLNDKITAISGVPRQIDVSIRSVFEGVSILTVIDTKDYGRRADIGEVDEFASKVRDVQGNRGVLICKGGFTSGARRAARAYGLELCNLHDAQSRRWNLYIKLPILWIDLTPHVRFGVEVDLEKGDSIQRDPTLWVITSDGGKSRLNTLSTFEHAWNEGRLPRDVGPEHTVRPAQDNLQLLTQDSGGNKLWRPIDDFFLTYTVSRRSWLGLFTPEECRGVLHYSDGRFEASYLPIGAIPIRRDETWTEVGNPEELAVSIPGTVVTTEGWQVAAGSGQFEDVSIVLKEVRGEKKGNGQEF